MYIDGWTLWIKIQSQKTKNTGIAIQVYTNLRIVYVKC